jgi:thiopeptide-type bacteriocin biosynthesis protein
MEYKVKRNFCLGSEWLYYKIYTGVKTADIILVEELYPIIKDLLDHKIITQWFFIRYKDPDEHLRIRFNCENSAHTATMICALYPLFNDYLEKDLVWKIQTDTYQRELERYGITTMEASEMIFFYDSNLVVDYLTLKPLFEKKEPELLFSCLAIDSFLNAFDLQTTDKMKLLDAMQESFKKEFNADKILKKEFDKHFREIATEMDNFISGKANDFEEVYIIIEQKAQAIKPIVQNINTTIQISLDSFLQSHIHMMVNRQYTSKQRMYECLIYDQLFRYYKMKAFRIRN